ncbi:MAG: cyclic nucleotide-binding [Trebouxia sp. A1-2]|nr:MAG: cyclic nucleotide-binding [Trebouxia sp. A1-2]
MEHSSSIRPPGNDTYIDPPAGVMSPNENNALSKVVNRSVEVDNEEWAALHKHSKIVQSLLSWWWRGGVPVINPYDTIYSCWCFYVLLTDATYTAFIVPIGVGFDTSDVAWDWAGYCDFIAGCTFAIELFLGWNVAFVATHNLRKRVVLRRRKIFWFYFWHGSFIFDFISTCVFIAQCVGYGIGLAGQQGGTTIQIIQIARALSLLQHMFVMSLSAPQVTIPIIRKTIPTWLSYFCQLGYIIALFINFMACVWVFVAQREGYNNTWINTYAPFVDLYAADDTECTSQEAHSIPGPSVCLAAAYWSLTTVSTIGFGDILPRSNAERAVMLFAQLMGVLFFGILLGSITSLLQASTRASKELQEAEMFRDKMSSVQTWMARLKLPRDLRAKIRAYYAEVWVHETQAADDVGLFDDLPQHLRAQVAWRQNKALMGGIHTFRDLDEQVQFLIAARGIPLQVAPGHELCAQGDAADCVWLLHEGELVATYHYREAETESSPAIVGVTALLAGSETEFRVRPCGYRASPDGLRAASDSDVSGSLDFAPTKQLVTPATKTGAAKSTFPGPGDERSKKPGGASNLAAGEQLLSGVLINMEEEAHVVIAIPQDDATDYMQQSSEQPTNQPTQSESNQHSDHADLLRSAVQPPPDADGILQTEEKDESQVPSDHVSVLHKERDHQQGKKTVFITVSPRGSIKVTSSNSQLTVRPDFSKNGG